MNNHSYIDFIVSRDGENSLIALAEKRSIETIPNLWYRINDKINFTFQGYTDLKKMPLWDFQDFQNVEKRLAEYLKIQKQGLDPWLVSPLALFSFRGCMKAVKEKVCYYCTSSEEKGRALPEQKLWEQILNLNREYGAETFYMADDIFPITNKRIKLIADAKPNEAKAKIRAYGYLPTLASLSQSELKTIAKNLQKIGVFNLFFGSENYDKGILSRMNKKGISVEETSRVIQTLDEEGGIKTTIAYLLGLPGTSQESLEINLKTLEKLLKVDGCIERLYLSTGIPLKGTQWAQELEDKKEIREEYLRITGKDPKDDDSPDYALLSKLSITHLTTVSVDKINQYLEKMIDAARRKIPDYRIGGFMLNISD
jgi:radical SAM superfamily enzyme YgiQ (UPF0313 family)